jgi:hypothetical protein
MQTQSILLLQNRDATRTREDSEAFHHVGLFFNESPSSAELPFFSRLIASQQERHPMPLFRKS